MKSKEILKQASNKIEELSKKDSNYDTIEEYYEKILSNISFFNRECKVKQKDNEIYLTNKKLFEACLTIKDDSVIFEKLYTKNFVSEKEEIQLVGDSTIVTSTSTSYEIYDSCLMTEESLKRELKGSEQKIRKIKTRSIELENGDIELDTDKVLFYLNDGITLIKHIHVSNDKDETHYYFSTNYVDFDCLNLEKDSIELINEFYFYDLEEIDESKYRVKIR